MDDKPDGTTQKKDGAGDTTNPPPPSLSDEKGAAVGAQDAKNPGQVPNAEVPTPTPSRWMRFRRWLITPEGTGVLMAVFTAAIAFTGIIGAILVWQGGKDTSTIADAAQKQVCAANRNADAAQQFADTAVLINRNVNDAVGKLDAQATGTQHAANAAESAADIAKEALATTVDLDRQERRPWVGLQDFRCEKCTSLGVGTLTIESMYGMMENTEKPPAVKMTIDAVWTDRKASDPIPDLDSIKSQMHDRNPYEVPPNLPPDMVAGITKLMETLKRLAEPPEVVLPPNAVRT